MRQIFLIEHGDHHASTGAAGGADEALAYADFLRSQDIIPKAIIVSTVCEACDSLGRVHVRPKGMRRDKFAKLPSWRKPSKPCDSCYGEGCTSQSLIFGKPRS